MLNARLGYSWRGKRMRGELSLAGKYLTGRDVIAFTEPDPDGNSYQPGPRRQLFAGVRVVLD